MSLRRAALVLLITMPRFAGWGVVLAARHGPSLPPASRAPRLIIEPNPVPLGRRIVVIVTGVKANEPVQFTAEPMKASFGGANMGTHRAGGSPSRPAVASSPPLPATRSPSPPEPAAPVAPSCTFCATEGWHGSG